MGDGARAVRAEDAFDVAAMDTWLRQQTELPPGVPEVKQFSGGASNLTYLLSYPGQELILRRPPAGTKAKSAHDMGREFRIQAALKPVFRYVPTMVAHCTDESVLGSDFYVMERVAGTIPRRSALGVELTTAQTRQLGFTLIDTLVELHAVDPAAAGLSDLGRGEGYVGRQVSGWSERYRKAKTWNVPSFEKVMAWLAANQPADARICVIHNDFRLDNVVLDPDEPQHVAGILDWELATLGDPLMDLGSALAYWVQTDDDWAFRRFRLQPSDAPGMLTRAEIVAYYTEQSGLKPENWAFYEVFGLFRLAAIAQQIYYRYHHKQTRNPKFKNFWLPVNLLERRCRRIIRQA
ncbi:phosphotransferase family protein [Kribbella sandramycini]|uniref:Aminoglycoside phosphotransferase (APT) family kinase protein n=1 Tax=Kribbella sandramycini TaxID=60450 RepID=A0A7Y4KZZ5_9ACTN|nr:phosphotransferase family protein [Kribbella sandramycini]MBB6565518.1 aminoglycoside phosphotransferase (APT) family kinase protein [Kribbella sandramycini]NOL41785.1 phosphotransferase family protein [Kribbella sandramycini]